MLFPLFQILVFAGLKDITRPPETLSVYQNTALAGTGNLLSDATTAVSIF